MSKIFFISDTHFGHKKIIQYQDRPFDSVEKMNQIMIDNWNRRASKDDDIYILGDLAFGNQQYVKNLINQLEGKKYLIRGNHDKHVDTKEIANKFEWIKDYFLLNHASGFKFVLFHYPIYNWAFKYRGSIHLYGHIHDNAQDILGLLGNVENMYNVSADMNNYEPIELNEILKKLGYKVIKRLEK